MTDYLCMFSTSDQLPKLNQLRWQNMQAHLTNKTSYWLKKILMHSNWVIYNVCDLNMDPHVCFSPTLSQDRAQPIPLAQPEACPRCSERPVALVHHTEAKTATQGGRGRGKIAPKLNGKILEEVSTYKYLGEVINNKGNLSDHIIKIEKMRSHRHYPCRNMQYRIQRNRDESHMANGGCHNHPNNNLLMWGVVHQQWREQNTTKYFQQGTKSHHLPTPRDPNHISPQRNRKYTNRIHHKKEANPTSKKDRWNEGRITNKRRNQNHTKHMEEKRRKNCRGNPPKRRTIDNKQERPKTPNSRRD